MIRAASQSERAALYQLVRELLDIAVQPVWKEAVCGDRSRGAGVHNVQYLLWRALETDEVAVSR